MNSSKFRRDFLNYFKKEGHTIIPSSPVVPHDDPTLLFTNAGMNQFKDVFLGQTSRDYTRATTSQKCIRAGGKHNDLENVGHTSRHLTFFEMLGNFSFGDYFKKEAIRFAMEVSTNVFQIDPLHIWPSVFVDDDEAFELWTKYFPPEKITRFGEKDNFWAMGDSGPCGPCSELYFDRGPAYGTAAHLKDDTNGERYIEFWNLVFMQYNRSPTSGQSPLPKPSIDTGAGLERILTLKMGVDSVFETDILRGLIAEIENVSKIKYHVSDHKTSSAFRVIADHIRSLSFAIADGAQPSNVDRGYVLRKILRRAVRYGKTLNLNEPFLSRVLERLILLMGDDYPELKKSQDRIAEILNLEEEAFLRTLKRGGNLLGQIIEKAQSHGNNISGDDAFKLKDTYGLPIEEIVLLAKDAGLDVDLMRFQEQEALAKERSRSAQKSVDQIVQDNLFEPLQKKHGSTVFTGYQETTSTAKIIGILHKNAFVNTLKPEDEAILILDRTPFYAEMGGQVGDTGVIHSSHGLFQVEDCQAPFKGIHAHIGRLVRGSISTGDTVKAEIDKARRQKIANNHTATHLLHWALQEVLGEHVKQAGSVVDAKRLRFDFSHHKALSPLELKKIEDLVNQKIRENTAVKNFEISYEEAQKKSDIKQFFGDKYGTRVRVVEANDQSKELCGGTHTSATGSIGLFKITTESSIAAGVRRIEAASGEEAEAFVRETETLLEEIANTLKTSPQQIKSRLEKILEEHKDAELQMRKVKSENRKQLMNTLIGEMKPIHGIPAIIQKVDVEPGELRPLADEMLDKVKSAVLILGCTTSDKGHLYIRVSDDWIQKGVKAQELIQKLAPVIDGSGGGKPQSAQAGGKAPEKLPDALLTAQEILRL